MFGERMIRAASVAGLLAGCSGLALAQTAEPPPVTPPAAETPAPAPPPAGTETPPAPAAAEPAPAAPTTTVPEVEVIQEEKKPAPKPTVAKKAPKPAPAPAPAPEPEPVAAQAAEPAAEPLPSVGPPPADTPVRMSPVAGSEIPLHKVPGAVGRADASDIQADATGQVQNVLNKTIPGVILSDTAGGGLRTDIQFRGFDASPIGGRSQGLAVYQNGVRINEAFGDTVNLDLIPAIAISDMTVLGANPVYGLNAIGGAIGITMKDGFSFEGGTIDAMGGSFGRGMISMEAGGNSGGVAAYAALELMRETGFRDFSEADVERFYGDLGFKGSATEVHLSLTAANSSAGVVAASPVEVLDVGWNRTFTSPQDTDLEVIMPTLSAKVQATDTLSFSGLAYYRKFKSKVVDGNLTEADECTPPLPDPDGLPVPPNPLCITEFEGGPQQEFVVDQDGNIVGFPAGAEALGSIERINTDAESYGGSAQAVSRADLFGRPNQFLLGTSYDHGEVDYTTSSEIGTIGRRFVVTGTGQIASEPEDVAPRDIATENDYFGVYFSNTLDVTDAFALTVGGRYNHATIKLADLTGDFPELTTTNKYERFNPMVGGTYQFSESLSLYGGYAEANRAPTAAELGCAEPDNPCLIESFLTDDPPLDQVVSRTFEVGLRGEEKYFDGSRFAWSAGLFRTLNEDDILNVAAEETGRGFFLNAGDTLRQGIELAASYQTRWYSVYGSYAFVDATFADDIVLPAPNTPSGTADCPDLEPGDFDPADPPQCNFVSDGDRLPGIPRHRFKAGFEYWLTPDWRVGSDLIAASDQVFFGDEANNNRKLAGYTRVDLHTTYRLSENAEAYGIIRNLFDQKYGLYGTFFDAEEAEEAAEAAGYDEFEDARSISPSRPFAIYGGLRVTF